MAKKRTARKISSAQPEQSCMYVQADGTTISLDLASMLTSINRKQYHQTKNLRPLLYHFRVQGIAMDSAVMKFGSAANTWTTKNAVVKLGAMYRKQLRDNGISIRQLPRYGRELRLALAVGVGYDHGSGSDGFAGSATLTNTAFPEDIDGATVFAGYTGSDGTSITQFTANDLTLISVPEMTADGEPETVVVSLTGTSSQDSNDMALIPEYLASRRNTADEFEEDVDFPSDDNLLMRIGATAGEHFDDIIDALEDTGDQRPYNEAGANQIVPQAIVCNAGDYASGVAPLGLLEFNGTANQEFLIWVTAITEM